MSQGPVGKFVAIVCGGLLCNPRGISSFRAIRMSEPSVGAVIRDRIALNKAFTEHLARNLTAAMSMLHEMDSLNLTGTDTINILLSHTLRSSQNPLIEAQNTFDYYFDTFKSSLEPNTVTLNIMMEGCRSANELSSLNEYFKLFRRYDLIPDKYTYSTLVRCSRNDAEIMRLLGLAKTHNQLTAPLLRTGIQSLGIHGCNPADIISLAFMLPGNHRPETSSHSADIIISSLLQPRTAKVRARELSTYGGMTGYEIAKYFILEDTYAISSRGYSSMFTHFHRNGISCPELRDAIWAKLISRKVELNGRLTDSYLRCFGGDVRSAIAAWKRTVRPFLVGVEDHGKKKEIMLKSMEAIIYSCGKHRRPDIALEVAISVRGKNWTASDKQALTRAYIHGRNQANASHRDLLRRLSDLLFTGFERSLEIELGSMFVNGSGGNIGRLPGRNIRLVFGSANVSRSNLPL